MCLRFAFLLITRVASWLRLSRREEAWKTAEILILRHQLAVLQRRQPRRLRLNWADRALLAALFSVIPKARRRGLRLLITPDTILCWHRDIVRRRRRGRLNRCIEVARFVFAPIQAVRRVRSAGSSSTAKGLVIRPAVPAVSVVRVTYRPSLREHATILGVSCSSTRQ
jgi:hypothetical protein